MILLLYLLIESTNQVFSDLLMILLLKFNFQQKTFDFLLTYTKDDIYLMDMQKGTYVWLNGGISVCS